MALPVQLPMQASPRGAPQHEGDQQWSLWLRLVLLAARECFGMTYLNRDNLSSELGFLYFRLLITERSCLCHGFSFATRAVGATFGGAGTMATVWWDRF